MEKLAVLYGCDMYDLYSENKKVIDNILATAFRIDSFSAHDMEQIASFKRIVRISIHGVGYRKKKIPMLLIHELDNLTNRDN